MNYVKRFTIRFASALAAALMMSGCASSHVLRDYTTDGCSFFPDGDAGDPGRWSDCCVNHDAAYWRGGTADERRSADVVLRDCVLAHYRQAGLGQSNVSRSPSHRGAAVPKQFPLGLRVGIWSGL